MKTRNEILDDFFGLDKPFHLDPRYPVEYDFSMLSKKEKRELENQTRSLTYRSKERNVPSSYIRDVVEIQRLHDLYDKAGLTDRERRNHWIHSRDLQRLANSEYSKTPTQERKDNKHSKVGSGGSNRNRIRFPKKNRSKATWRRFYKLFPHLDPENKKSL